MEKNFKFFSKIIKAMKRKQKMLTKNLQKIQKQENRTPLKNQEPAR